LDKRLQLVMNRSLPYTQSLKLRPGIALSQDQIAILTDKAWLPPQSMALAEDSEKTPFNGMTAMDVHTGRDVIGSSMAPVQVAALVGARGLTEPVALGLGSPGFGPNGDAPTIGDQTAKLGDEAMPLSCKFAPRPAPRKLAPRPAPRKLEAAKRAPTKAVTVKKSWVKKAPPKASSQVLKTC
jgi:hypothetical protein